MAKLFEVMVDSRQGVHYTTVRAASLHTAAARGVRETEGERAGAMDEQVVIHIRRVG